MGSRMGSIACRWMLAGGVLVMALGADSARAQSFADIDSAVQDGIQKGIYPGAVVVIGRRDSLLYARGYGHFTWGLPSLRPDPVPPWGEAGPSHRSVVTAVLACVV